MSSGDLSYFVVSDADLVEEVVFGSFDMTDYPVIKKGASSYAYLRFVKRGCAITVGFTMGVGTTTAYEVLLGVNTGTRMSYPFDLLYAAATASGKQEYYYRYISNQAPAALTGATAAVTLIEKNPLCWATQWDFSGVPVGFANPASPTLFNPQHGGCLITRRHLVEARHFVSPVGAKWAFIGTDGEIYYATSIGVSPYQAPEPNSYTNEYFKLSEFQGDIVVHTLDFELPPEVKVYPVAGSWISQYVSGSYDVGYAIVENHSFPNFYVWLDQKRRARFNGIMNNDTVSQATTIKSTIYQGITTTPAAAYLLAGAIPPPTSPSELFYDLFQNGRMAYGVRGDSGSSIFYPKADGGLIVCSGFTAPGGGPCYSAARLNPQIAAADANAIVRGYLNGTPTGLTVTVAPDPTL